MRAGTRDTSEPSEFGDAPSPGSREIQPRSAAASRAGWPASAFSGRDVRPFARLSAPASAVTSRREAHPERPIVELLPAASAARGWRFLTMSSTPRCSGSAAQVGVPLISVPKVPVRFLGDYRGRGEIS